MNYLISIFLLLTLNIYRENVAPIKILSTNIEYKIGTETNNNSDSLMLQNAIKLAKENLHLDSYSHTYQLFREKNKDYPIATIDIAIGNLFSNDQKHLRIRIEGLMMGTNGSIFHLYHVVNDDIQPIYDETFVGCFFATEEYMDINGDGYTDFLIAYESSSGCCPRIAHKVLIYNLDGKFSKPIEFLNANFSIENGIGIVRGFSYGYPEDIGLYKYQWNGSEFEAVEFIYHNSANKKQFIKTTKEIYMPTETQGIVLTEIPTEYHNINDYSWFTNF